MLKVNQRTNKVIEAGLIIRKWLSETQLRYGLTEIEYLQILAEETSSVLKYMLRTERHGDSDRPADLEG